jgi:putative ABC transport system permease protein
MRLSSIAHLYRVRLQSRAVLVQELLAVFGLAVGVALLFASQISTVSLNDSVARLTREIVGQMQLQLDARGPRGFDQRVLGEVRQLPGVRGASPVFEAPANAVGPAGRRGVELIGIDPRFALKGNRLLQRFDYAQVAHLWALAVPSPIAAAIGVQPLEGIKLQLAGREVTALVGAELSGGAVGALAGSPVVIAPLAYAQHLAGTPNRLTRVYVQVFAGREREVRAGLRALAGNTLNVQPADFDATLFGVAAAPVNQGEGLFAAISALVGFLFAFNAILLTVPLRRSLVSSLRANGATRTSILSALLFDAVILGGSAVALGLALGDGLSLLVYRASPGYLSFAFPIGTQRVVTWQCVALAVGAGTLAAGAGVLLPLRHALVRSSAGSRSGRDRANQAWRIGALLGGACCLAATTAILLVLPQSAVLGCVTLTAALLLLSPFLLDGIVVAFDRIQAPFGSAASRIAVVELKSPTTRTRSLAIAATAAVAVFGSVAIEGAHANLQHGLDRLFRGVTSVSDLWVVPPGRQNLLATVPFRDTPPTALVHLPGIGGVEAYRGGFLDFGKRRVWVLAPPSSAVHPIPPGQMVSGDTGLATARLRAGGWAVLSQSIASQDHLRIGQSFTLTSPHPRNFRVAALITNLGWPPGAVILSPADYVRAWGNADPSAYNVTLQAGAPLAQVHDELERALAARNSALTVQTSAQRDALQQTASRQGLSRLTQIASLVLIATALAMSIAMGTMIWQRRPRLARMKVQGYRRGVLWRALLCETALLLGAGCSIGAAFGIYGELLISHALASVTGFPVLFTVEPFMPIAVSVLVSGMAVAVVAIPGYRAAGVTAHA